MLVEEALQDKSNGTAADWKAICTDAHTENAKRFVEPFESVCEVRLSRYG